MIDEIQRILEDAVDFWTGRHPAERIASNRNWRIPQIAGYENHPRYAEVAKAFDAMPLSKSLRDFVFVNKIKGDPSATGSYNTKTGIAHVIPFKPLRHTEVNAAHELGHHFLKKYWVRQNEYDPDIMAAAVLRGESPKAAFDKYDWKEGIKYYNDAVDKYVPEKGLLKNILRNGKYEFPTIWR